MGYSCSRDAVDSLRVICNLFGDKKSSNVLVIKGLQFFFERGQEQADGAITGPVFLMVENGNACKAGTFRIEADGTVTRFPHLSKTDREEAANTMRDMQARNPQLLRTWGAGCV